MSGLTDWERHRVDVLGRQLAAEDPELAARLTGSVQDGHPRGGHRRALGAVGWTMATYGAVLLLSGTALMDVALTTWGVLVLACCWVPSWCVRKGLC